MSHEYLIKKLRQSCWESLEWYVAQCVKQKAEVEIKHLKKVNEMIEELKAYNLPSFKS